jgi:hypothetical protein
LCGIGSILKSKTRNEVIYSVSSIKYLTTILIPQFLKYGLLTQKAADFIFFTRTFPIVNQKEPLSIEGLYQILNIKASMNLGLSDVIKSNFSNITPVERPIVLTRTNNKLDPN